MTIPDEEIERFKTDIDLRAVAAKYGYEITEDGRASTAMENAANDSKLIISVKPDGHWTFWDAKNEGFRGTVLQFVARMEGLDPRRDFLKICLKCRGFLEYAPPAPGNYTKLRPIAKRPHDDLFKEWRNLKSYQGGYLESRGIDQHTIERFASKIRTDAHGNTCFLHQDLHGAYAGWEEKNHDWKHFLSGGEKSLFIQRVDEAAITAIIVCESAIDAMSYYQLTKQPGLYVSFGGTMSPAQETMLADLLHQYPGAQVHAATDNDKQGEKYAAFLGRVHDKVERRRPAGAKDWNDALQASLSRSR